MAKAVSADAIRQNLIEVSIDGDAYFEAAVEFDPSMYASIPVRSARRGAVPIKYLNTGATFKGRLLLLETTPAVLELVAGITTNLPLAVGEDMPTHALRFHDPNEADGTNDVLVPKAVFIGGAGWTDDGQGNRVFSVPFEGSYDDTAGGAWKIAGA